MKFSIRGGKKEDEIDEKELSELAQHISGEGQEPGPEPVPEPETSAYDEIREKFEDLQARVEQVDSSTSALRSELGQFDQRFNSIETNVREMLSLYEIATKSQNPFFQADSSEGASKTNAQEANKPLTDPGSPLSFPSDHPVVPEVPEEDRQGPEVPDKGANDSFMLSNRPGLPRLDDVHEERIVDELTPDDLDNAPITNMLVLRWIEYIMQKVGYTGLSSTLDYYVQIGWITREAAKKIMAFSVGIDLHGSGAKPPKKSTLTVREHLVSLYFVTKLKKNEVFDNIYVSVKDEVEKLGLSLSSESL